MGQKDQSQQQPVEPELNPYELALDLPTIAEGDETLDFEDY